MMSATACGVRTLGRPSVWGPRTQRPAPEGCCRTRGTGKQGSATGTEKPTGGNTGIALTR